jgi:hypothetical protein
LYSTDLHNINITTLYNSGEEPVDPTVGFLPPNNGTTGQGYVTFRVRVNQDVETLSRIDAEANIFFDQNEPIATPPIFNTVNNFYYNIIIVATRNFRILASKMHSNHRV